MSNDSINLMHIEISRDFFSYFRYMDTVNAYRNFSPTSSASSSADNAGNGSSSSRLGPQPFGGKKSDLASPTFGSVSPALSSDSRGGQIQSPSNSNSTSGLPKSKKSSPGKKFYGTMQCRGPFIYYVSTCRGEGGQKMPIFAYS